MVTEYRTPAIGSSVITPDGPGVMAGVTGSRYAVTYPEGVPSIGMAPGSTMGYDPLSVRPATYADQVTRTVTDLHHWGHMGMSGVEFTVTYGYPDAPDETQHLRIAYDANGGEWKLYTLTHAHGRVDYHAPFPATPIHRDVIARISATPGTFAGSAPTRAFVDAFYADPR